MSTEIIVALIGFVGTILTVVSQNNKTRNEMKNEITLIKNDMSYMKTDIKEHNHYAKMFAETMPVVQEQIKVANHRIDDLERKADRC